MPQYLFDNRIIFILRSNTIIKQKNQYSCKHYYRLIK